MSMLDLHSDGAVDFMEFEHAVRQVCIHVYVYIFICMCMYVCVYVHVRLE